MAEPRTLYTSEIDDFSLTAHKAEENKEGPWALFKQIRGYGLADDQIAILVRKFGLDMALRDIQVDMGFTSYGSLYRRYKDALEILKRGGFRNE